MDKVLVNLQGVSSYKFEDEKTNKIVQGTSAWFSEVQPVANETTKGFIPKKVNLPLEAFELYKDLAFPIKVYAMLETRFTNRGVVTKINNFELVK